jgi:Kef-type K+ transport system membrane component KefB
LILPQPQFRRASFAILLLQDLAIVPLLALLPVLGSDGVAGGPSVALRLARVGVVLFGRWRSAS